MQRAASPGFQRAGGIVTRQDELAAQWVAAMRRGDHCAAWDLTAVVRGMNDPVTRDDPRLPYHLRWVWDGGPFEAKHVLVRCYHGLGDTLQFARYLPALRQRVASLTLEVQPELLPLLRGMPGIDRLVPFDPAHPLPTAECDFEIMELAAALRIKPAMLPPPALRVTPQPLVAGRVVGLCWRAGGWSPARSVPEPSFRPLAAGPCVSLCPGPTELPVLNPAGCPATVAQTASLIAALALVVTVDTMVAHLAASLGVPTWLLLKHDADWRWMADRRDSPWYPSMTLYRQEVPGDWDAPLAAIVADAQRR